MICYNKNSDNLLDLGFVAYYLNRTNRSGVLIGVVVEGLNQRVIYNIYVRYYKKELIGLI